MADKQPIIIGNWKMKLGIPESKELASNLKKKNLTKVEVVICPSFVALTEVAKFFKHTDIALGAQDCFWESQGSFTGEVSASYLKEAGCDFVILGHSERRKYLAETDEMIHRKIGMALSAGLVPIVCVGETFEQRQDGSKDYTLIQQTTKALEGVQIGPDQRVIIAYEPVWVIGTGQAIEPDEAAMSQQVIRQVLFDLFTPSVVKSNFSVIYGGSVDGSNAAKLIGLEENDGFLVGGASQNADDFQNIIKELLS